MTHAAARGIATTATGFASIAHASSVSVFCLACAPGLESLAYRRRRCDMAPFQAAKIPLVKTELLCSLDLRQAQGLTSALEAHS